MLTRVVKLHWNLEDGGRQNRRNPGAASHAATPLQGHAVLCSKITDVHGIEVHWVRT